ncbi:hypothetical protein VIGAN_08293400, partial [Vigna angularis var. angularis]
AVWWSLFSCGFAVWLSPFSSGFATTELVIKCFDLGLCRNSSSFPQIPPGSKIRVLQMGERGKTFCLLTLAPLWRRWRRATLGHG